MKQKLSKRIWGIIACPSCGGTLYETKDGAQCASCKEEFSYTKEGQLDLRLHQKKAYDLKFELGARLFPEGDLDFVVLEKNISPQVDFSNIRIPKRLNEVTLSYFPKAKNNDSLMLDLGCGSADHKEICEHAGFEYIGFDYDSSRALLLGDAHALPFKSNSFEFVLTVAVLEHIQYPFVMMKEVHRILSQGGKLIGSVAFLEPYHASSFYHNTHLGIFNLLQFVGFHVEHISPSVNWSGILAQASMGLFPKLPRIFVKFIIMPIHLLHRIWWKLGYITHSIKASDKYRILYNTGAFTFIASKK